MILEIFSGVLEGKSEEKVGVLRIARLRGFLKDMSKTIALWLMFVKES